MDTIYDRLTKCFFVTGSLGIWRMCMGELQQFGGEWTIQKLDILTGYLDAYLVALKYMKFKKSMLMLLRAPVASLPVMGNEKLQDQQARFTRQ